VVSVTTREALVRKRTTGVREAKAQFSALLRDVRAGHEWVITERGAPIAKLVPIPAEDRPLAERVRRLVEAGAIEPEHGERQPLPPPLPLEKGLAQRWLREDRGE
jgi:prevent-host-death family protein